MFKILIISLITFMLVIIIFLIFMTFMNMDIKTNSKSIEKFYNAQLTYTGGAFKSLVNGSINYFYIQFNSSGTLTIPSSITCDILIVGGGGSGGGSAGGGGGAGGLIYSTNQLITAGTYNIVVGSGAKASWNQDSSVIGGNSSFNGLIAYGGGGGEHMGGEGSSTALSYTNGGSGGGGQRNSYYNTYYAGRNGGSGVSGQGNNGGQGKNANGNDSAGGGGGGAGGAGSSAYITGRGANGGIGRQISITGTNIYYAGGGGGGSALNYNTAGSGGLGGGGNGAIWANNGTNGINGLGGGGGGGSSYPGTGTLGGAGGSGVVIIRHNISQSTIYTDYSSDSGTYLRDSNDKIIFEYISVYDSSIDVNLQSNIKLVTKDGISGIPTLNPTNYDENRYTNGIFNNKNDIGDYLIILFKEPIILKKIIFVSKNGTERKNAPASYDIYYIENRNFHIIESDIATSENYEATTSKLNNTYIKLLENNTPHELYVFVFKSVLGGSKLDYSNIILYIGQIPQVKSSAGSSIQKNLN